VATLRRYSIVRQRRRSKLFSPERAILAAFCVIAGAGVFMVTNGAGRQEPTALDRLASGQPLIRIPIASHIAQTLDKIGDGLEGKTKPRRLSPAEVAALLEQKRKQTETEKLLAAERRRQSQQLFAKRNIDRTPVATIPPKVSPGFTEVRASSPGFREIPRWRPQ
jgi:hypothetical protein